MASLWTALRRWGGPGLLVLGVIDSSLIPTLGSLDIFNALLAARHRDLWWFYALMSTVGSVIGAYLMYRLARKAGMGWLQSKLGEKRVARVNCMLEKYGVAAVVIAVIAPPPFPSSPFFVAAGALKFPIRKYMTAVVAGRAFRYSLVAWIASHYSRRIIRVFRHPDRYLAITLGITAALVLLAITAVVIWSDIGRQVERAQQEARDKQAAANL
ncbi:MAG: VTT domain-containing protein [Acidobacteriia bacterium]|nr:VTT domain-containing protein [Terriglobia bacterium]